MVGNQEQLRKGIWGVSGGRKLNAKFDLILQSLKREVAIKTRLHPCIVGR